MSLSWLGLKQIKVVDNEDDAAQTLTAAVQEASRLAELQVISFCCHQRVQVGTCLLSYEERGTHF